MSTGEAPMLEALFRQATQLMAVLSVDGRVLTTNDSALGLVEGSPDTMTGRAFWDTSWWRHDPGIQEWLREAITISALGGHCHREVTHPSEDGLRVVDFTLSPLRDPSGEIAWLLAEGRDVTGTAQAAKALRENEAKFRQLFDHSADGILLLDGDRFTDCNPEVLRMMRCSGPEFLRLHPWELSPPFQPDARASEEKAREMIRTAFERGMHRFEWIHRRVDGTDFPVEVTLIPVPLGGKTVLYTTWRDISERMAANQALRDSEARFRTVAFLTGQLIYDIDLPSGLVRWDGAIEEIAGCPPEVFRAEGRKEWRDRIHPEDLERVLREIEAGEAAGGPFQCEYRFRRSDGAWRTVRDKGLFLPDAEGRSIRRLGALSDVTDLRRAEQERLDLERQVFHAQKLESLGVLAGGIAHDFNNLLTAILGNLNLAQLHLAPESPAQPYLESMERTVLRASELTRQMLAYSGRGRFVVGLHDLNLVIQEMTHLVKVSISKKIAVRQTLEPNLPAIEADAAQIQQVILNLVTNASDAIGNREGTIRIATGYMEMSEAYATAHLPGQAIAPGPFVTLEVNDSGCGMTREVLERIFDPFFTTKEAGHGLGLSAMQGILRGHRGGIRVYSEPGKGTTFKLFFPAQSLPAMGARTEVPATEWHPTGVALLVDDEPGILDVTSQALQAMGFEVVTALDGRDAMRIFHARGNELVLVLMDLTMPHMDGRETFLAMHRLKPSLPIILSSGFTEQEAIQEVTAKGLAGFIQKPYQLRELHRMVRDVMNRARTEPNL